MERQINLAGYTFQGPFNPYKGFSGVVAAVYAILDSRKVVDIGQTEDLNNRFPNHPRQNQWEACGEGTLTLYILSETQQQYRLAVESFLRQQFNPPCGER